MNGQLLWTVLRFHALAALLPVSMIVLYRRPGIWAYAFATFLGIVTAMIDSATEEVQLPVLLLLVFGFFLGFQAQRRAWLTALLLALWIPAFNLVRIVMDHQPDKLAGEGFGSLIALVPAFVGTFAGAILRGGSSRRSETTKGGGAQSP